MTRCNGIVYSGERGSSREREEGKTHHWDWESMICLRTTLPEGGALLDSFVGGHFDDGGNKKRGTSWCFRGCFRVFLYGTSIDRPTFINRIPTFMNRISTLIPVFLVTMMKSFSRIFIPSSRRDLDCTIF